MAIRLNLYHEILRARRQEQYDPLKLSFIGLLVAAVCLAGFYVLQLGRTNSVRSEYQAKKAEFDRLSPLAKAAREREVELTKQIELASRITDRMEKRFYWAPVFESVVVAVPANVQITKLSGDAGRDGSRQCQVTLEGVAAGEDPRAAAEEMRRSIADRLGAKYPSIAATFRNLDESPERSRLDGKILPTAVFTINVTFKAETGIIPAQKPIAQRN